MPVQKKYPALGRGLDALISTEEVLTQGSSSVGEVPIGRIVANPGQPRREFDDAALGVYFCMGLDAEGGRIAMGGNDACACLGQGLRAHLKGEDGGIILGHVEAAAGLNVLQRFCGIVSRIASSIQLLRNGLDGAEIHRRGIEEI